MNQRDTITRNPRLYSDVETVSRSSSPASTSTTLRPRNKRISTTEQELISTSGTSTPSLSRGVSPIPSKHLSRSSANTRENGSPGRQPAGNLVVPTTGRGSSRSSSPVGASIGSFLQSGWSNSWTTLQGVANSVLGGDLDIGTPTESANNGIYKHRRKASSNPTKPPSTWGPSSPPKRTESGIGEGSTAAREEELRRRRTAGVLESHEGMVNGGLDINGRYKRRMSLEDTRTEDEVADALVYIHHVQPHDTIAGVVLKYNCQMAVFKKANRLWAQDTIQVRKVLFLPVDACAIKGRPCDAPSTKGVDLLAPTPSAEDGPNTNGGSWPKFNSQNETPAERLDRDEDAPWIHVRWVLLDSSPSSKPVEIARMPRKTLGYFPPRRRKSQATISTISTPRDSMDIPRSSDDRSGSAASTPNRRTSLLGPRPSSGSYFPPTSLPARSGRPRRESTSEAAERLGWMRGPGGVGTLSGKNVRMPGPARDGLNTFANKHIPGLAIDNLPSTSVLGSETAQFGFSGEEPANIAEAPFGSTSISGAVTTSGQNLGLENAAAAVEGFFRRIVTKVPGTPRLGGTPTAVDGGDLIELLDGAGSDDGRGFELSPGSVRIGGSGREDLEGLVRGRVSAAVKGGKTD